ncbi:glycosyltransferase family 4 protein [Streptomyces sp. NPDC001568]|uniref:glycosyltransferase family 4 protein n=1 Tax=Streptomyces sp. NPDC001568 TaxID=3364588 RepID=UPI0036B1FBA7
MSALRREIPRAVDPVTASGLIDLATAAGLQPLDPAEWSRLLHGGRFGARVLRHALWRHLADKPAGRRLLPASATAADPYERLLLTAAGGRFFDFPGLPHGDGLLVVQSMLVGAMDNPGEGLSGGLGVFLGSLGDTLAQHAAVDAVITLVTADAASLRREPSLLRRRGEGHWTLGLPVDDHDSAGEQAGTALAWWIRRLLSGMPRRPDLMHVRFADDRSLAVAEAAGHLSVPLVFTATPDPHRRLNEHRAAREEPEAAKASEELRHDLHRVFVADRLVDRAHKVVAIPGRGGTAELISYFPQLVALGSGLSAPPEGITTYRPAPNEPEGHAALLKRLYGGGDGLSSLDPTTRPLPLFLTVGRMHPVKQQYALVRGWLDAGLHRRSAMVIIGGTADLDASDIAEREVRTSIESLLDAYPQAAGRLALMPALPNAEVRRLERALADSDSTGQAYYVCPSAKEEFGIAVLEAMDAGLPVAATDRGGIPHYLQDGVNGLLLDASSPTTLAAGLSRLLAVPPGDLAAMRARAADTVRSAYSIEAAASAFATVYLDVAADQPRDRRALAQHTRASGYPDAALERTPTNPGALEHERSARGYP